MIMKSEKVSFGVPFQFIFCEDELNHNKDIQYRRKMGMKALSIKSYNDYKFAFYPNK